MDPEERKKLLEKLEVAKARKAELDDKKKIYKGVLRWFLEG
jgi:phage gp16-like protein